MAPFSLNWGATVQREAFLRVSSGGPYARVSTGYCEETTITDCLYCSVNERRCGAERIEVDDFVLAYCVFKMLGDGSVWRTRKRGGEAI